MKSVEHLLRAVDDLDSAVLMFVGLDGTIQYVNSGVGKLLGYEPDELTGESMILFMPAMVRAVHERLFSDPDSFSVPMDPVSVASEPGDRQGAGIASMSWHDRLHCTVSHKSGRSIPVELTVSETWTEDGRRWGYLAFMLDSSEIQGLQEKLRRKETFDEQTGLLCLKGFQSAIANRRDHDLDTGGYSLIHLDIDHFSALSFESSHVADNAIRAFATWLQVRLALHKGDMEVLLCKHFNGSEFVIYLADSAPDPVMALARNIRADFSRINLATDQKPFHTSLSMGVATVTDGVRLERGLSRAANACYIARARGGDRIVVARDKDLRIYQLAEQVREALLGQRIEVHAQKIKPLAGKESLSKTSPLHFEVLCRLRDPAGHLLTPDLIFPAAESLGLVLSIDIHMIRATLNLILQFSDSQDWLARCSFNLSAVTLSHEKTYREIRAIIEKSGIAPEKLCFEMTESAAIRDSQSALANLTGLRELGCRIAIDDFGSGFSNYQSLSSWPVDIIKIDGAYIRALMDSPSLHVDTQGMIASARTRGMEVVAEYAESEAIVRELMRLGVDYAQGYQFHRPEPLSDLLQSLPDPNRP